MNKVVITRIDDHLISAYLIGETVYDLLIKDDKPDDISVGDIYVGRVQNVVDNIRAAFVEIGKGVIGYLPLSEEQKKHVKAEQEIIVQVKKPAKGTKEAVLTTNIELIGRYLVFQKKSNNTDRISVSRKIKVEETVNLLKDMVTELAGDPDPYITIRTNASGVNEALIKSEYEMMHEKWKDITLHGSQRTMYSRLYREQPFYIRHINNYGKEQIERIITDQDDVYDELIRMLPEMTIERYEDISYPLEARYAVSTTMKKASDRLVWLKSGANLIIDRTEAMTVIDVNTAKAVEGKRASESTFFKINMEATDEVARQLRLRNISGIILVDFIDMKEKEHNDQLISRLREKLSEDPVRAVYVDMTGLGIIEITRAKRF